MSLQAYLIIFRVIFVATINVGPLFELKPDVPLQGGAVIQLITRDVYGNIKTYTIIRLGLNKEKLTTAGFETTNSDLTCHGALPTELATAYVGGLRVVNIGLSW